jgi:hypothetical protein
MLGIIEPYPIVKNKWFVYVATTIIILCFPIVCFAFVISFTFDNHYSMLVLQPNHDIIYICAHIYFFLLSLTIFLMSKATKILATIALGLSIVGLALEIFFIYHQHTTMLFQTWFFSAVFLIYGFIYFTIDSVPGRVFSWTLLVFSLIQLIGIIPRDPRIFGIVHPYRLRPEYTIKWSLVEIIPLTIILISLVIYLMQLLPKEDKRLKDNSNIITY